MNNKPTRKPTRLKGYDYSSNGAVFVTVCMQNRSEDMLSTINFDDEKLCCKIDLSPQGKIIERYITLIPSKYPDVKVEKYVIMPDHIHMIVTIEHTANKDACSTGLSTVMGWFKYQTTKEINILNNTPGLKIYQRSFNDHIIRDEDDFLIRWQYIEDNPNRWQNKRTI